MCPTLIHICLLAWLFSHVAAANLTSFVNLFIGTASGANGGSGGNAFPGAAVPHGMVKVGIDVNTSPRQAGYIADNSSVTGISLMHDEGTGGNTNGGYGFFPLFPLFNCTFASCPVGLDARQAQRAAGADAATPGYFTTIFVNGIKLESTSTRSAGLIRFTYPETANQTHVVVDLTNDLQRSFQGGGLEIDSNTLRIKLHGTFLQSYGPANYTAYGCYDFDNSAGLTFGTYRTPPLSNVTSITANSTSLDFPFPAAKVQAGALFSFSSKTVVSRFGVSFISADQACANAEREIPGENSWDWDGVQTASADQWEDVLQRVATDSAAEDKTVVTLLYSSLYRASLVPANLTGENPYWETSSPFFDALFCSWDTFRTVHPLLSITSPREWAKIVSAYVDGWKHTGYIPECRSNTKPGYVQGGSDGMPILGDFAVKYGHMAADLGVAAGDLYQALVDTAENTPPDWTTVGRQNTAWKMFNYIPTDWVDPSGSVGLPTREASRAYEYALGDFAVRQASLALGISVTASDVDIYTNRSMNFVNMWDSSLVADGFTGFAQRKYVASTYSNGTFAFSPPDACSPVDPVSHSCARGADNNVGFYESSSWEMSFFAPHSMATMVELMGGKDTFIQRLDHYFAKPYFQAGNEPSFQIPWAYHYGGRPDLSAKRVRKVVYENFGVGINGLPGNDDSGAMASLLVFHILGLYPVPASNQLLIGSPLVSSYTLSNDVFGTKTKFTVRGFDKATLNANSGTSAAAGRVFVTNISINGVASESLCWIPFSDVVGGGEVVITVSDDAEAAKNVGCGSGANALPASLSTGGFSTHS